MKKYFRLGQLVLEVLEFAQERYATWKSEYPDPQQEAPAMNSPQTLVEETEK